MTRGKKVRFEGITLLRGRIMGESDERRYKYLGITKADVINEKEMKKKVKKKAESKIELKE